MYHIASLPRHRTACRLSTGIKQDCLSPDRSLQLHGKLLKHYDGPTEQQYIQQGKRSRNTVGASKFERTNRMVAGHWMLHIDQRQSRFACPYWEAIRICTLYSLASCMLHCRFWRPIVTCIVVLLKFTRPTARRLPFVVTSCLKLIFKTSNVQLQVQNDIYAQGSYTRLVDRPALSASSEIFSCVMCFRWLEMISGLRLSNLPQVPKCSYYR